MSALAVYLAAALAEIGGCFLVWLWWREGRGVAALIAAVPVLLLFAFLLARSPALFAGRAYAAYGGVYIAASLLWLWAVEGMRPDRFDLLGAALALAGAMVILHAPRG